MASTASSRRNSTATVTGSVGGGSRRGSVDSDGGFPFRLKKSKPVSQVKIVFMGKSMVYFCLLTSNMFFYESLASFSGVDGSSE